MHIYAVVVLVAVMFRWGSCPLNNANTKETYTMAL